MIRKLVIVLGTIAVVLAAQVAWHYAVSSYRGGEAEARAQYEVCLSYSLDPENDVICRKDYEDWLAGKLEP